MSPVFSGLQSGAALEISRQLSVSIPGLPLPCILLANSSLCNPNLLYLTPSITQKAMWGQHCFLWNQRGLAPRGSFLEWILTDQTTATIN